MNFFGDSKPISIFEIGSKMTELEMVMLAKKSKLCLNGTFLKGLEE